MAESLITVAVPSYNQGRYLDDALASIFQQALAVEVFVLDGGSTDCSLDVIEKWKPKLAGWRSHADRGQASAINEGIGLGRAPYVCWLNSDDWFLPAGLQALLNVMEADPHLPAVYGRSWNYVDRTGRRYPAWVEAFDEHRLALRCIVSQPATLIRRSTWEAVGGVDESLHMAMDYDLWWKLYRKFGPMQFIDAYVAVNREHGSTKTKTQRRLHYKEAMGVVRKYHGSVPLKWWLAQPYAVWFKSVVR